MTLLHPDLLRVISVSVMWMDHLPVVAVGTFQVADLDRSQ